MEGMVKVMEAWACGEREALRLVGDSGSMVRWRLMVSVEESRMSGCYVDLEGQRWCCCVTFKVQEGVWSLQFIGLEVGMVKRGEEVQGRWRLRLGGRHRKGGKGLTVATWIWRCKEIW